eukprot:TRINITY_DN6917_c0_g2_i4.p1 TRINITY_DN6917_c0_g2~~TRINITY_DN6917_c0_g2_i4.p1  ORF type:complete len:311 (-),score=79.24 TRINITY_DN6917_c0_g2_i4:230-1162(-)
MAASDPITPGEKKNPDVKAILKKAGNSAFRGGTAGAVAMCINVSTLMWMRTTINYQYRYGTGTFESFRILYKEGGVGRFYRGIGFALIQGPWSRFGDTAANTGALELLNSFDETKDLSPGYKTLVASVAASSFRVMSTPLDTCKTIMQVEGKAGLAKLKTKFQTAGGVPRGLPVLWYGALGSASATFVGHYPWFATYNMMQAYLPHRGFVPESAPHAELLDKLVRNAVTGFCASAVSDTCSNSIRVLKVYKQTHSEQISYPRAFKEVVAKDGVLGMMGRGLGTKIASNGVQGMLFAVLWKMIDDKFRALF